MNASAVDAVLSVPAVVFGSLPPGGRDLDLLVRSSDLAQLADDLLRAGWQRQGRTFVRFADCTAFAVDLVDIGGWAANPAFAEGLLSGSVPIPGCTMLRAPAEHHRLLVLARRLELGMRLDETKREQLASFDPAVWEAARGEAQPWGLRAALERLATGTDEGRAALLARARQSLPLDRPPRVIALSGLDGAGKSTHAEHLRTALEALGYDVSVQWTKIAREEWLKAAAAPIRRLVNVVLARHVATAGPLTSAEATGAGDAGGAGTLDADAETRNYPDGPPPPPDPAKLLRQRSGLLTAGWTLVLAVANGITHRREVRRRGTRIVICDRYVLDTMAHLRHRYGFDRSFRLQGAVDRLLSPRPTAAFFLDVAPATARARKPEQYTTSDLGRLRECYLDAASRLPVTVVDGEQPRELVAARIAAETWRRLSS